MSTDNLIINISAQRDSRLLTNMQLFSALTVGFTTLGAAVACWQIYRGTVGILEVTLLLAFYFPTAIGIEAGFHRYFSHSAFRGGVFVTWMMGILGSLAAQGPILFWAATHRKHHAFTDKEGDPHSPNIQGRHLGGRIKGLLHAHVVWLFSKEQASWAKFAPDLVRSREIIAINSSYLIWVVSGLLLPALISGVITQSWSGAFNGLIWGGLFRIFLLNHVTWTINSICHTVGSQPHELKDNSRNIFLLCILSVGGSFHNNHHAYPIGARNDHQSRLQLDLSGMFIELLGLIGLAKNIKRYKHKS